MSDAPRDDRTCFICGEKNPIGLKLRLRTDPERGESAAEVTFRDDFQGWTKVVHGGLLAAVRKRAGRLTRSITVMEVCGSHTNAIGRFGIRGLLPENIRLISGPGCPVCVTHDSEVAAFLELAGKNAIITTFGDMLKVKGSKAGDKVAVTWNDNKGDKNSAEATVG